MRDGWSTPLGAPVTRRVFLASTALLRLRTGPVRLDLAGEHPGATLALEEMTQTAALLERSIARGPHAAAMTLDVDGQTLQASGVRYFIAASSGARAAALAAWTGPAARAAVEWHPDLAKYGAEQLNARFLQRFARPMDAVAWRCWMLVKVAVESQLRAVTPDAGRFDGHKGVPLVFGADRHLVQPLCLVGASGALLGVTE